MINLSTEPPCLSTLKTSGDQGPVLLVACHTLLAALVKFWVSADSHVT